MGETETPEQAAVLLPLLPLPDVVLPQMVVTLGVESPEAQAAIEAGRGAGADGRLLLVPKVGDRYARVGTVARIESVGDLGGRPAVVLRGVGRAVVRTGVASERPGVWVEAEPVPADGPATGRGREMAREFRAVVRGIADRLGARRLAEALLGVEEPGALADTAGWWPDLPVERKVELLETLDPEERLRRALEWAREMLGELDVSEQIRARVTDDMDRTQREYVLRQQLAAIRKELGEDGDVDVVGEYRRRIAERNLPDAVRVAADREVDRLERTGDQSPEHSWIRSWLDTVLDVPWGERSQDRLDVVAARAVLDADHTGLDDVKDRVIEHLAVRKLRAERGLDSNPAGRGAGAILALVGPPGVGKTSLGESIARALGRQFVRIALGGVHDEAEIRGHRRTYIGARPGRVVRALTEAGTMNPVVVLDEVDKVGADWRGDPSSALLEVLDPEQNHTFRDHYLEIDLDLSDVLFLATANQLDTIPSALLDRLEVIRLDGYTEDEKVAIARDHLLVRQIDRNGLHGDDVHVSDDALRRIVVDHTREAGVRNLERELGKLLRKVAARVAGGDAVRPVEVDGEDVASLLGRPKFYAEAVERTTTPGVATGLAVTGTGGDVLFVEATAMDGEPGLTLTGQLGDVMKESAQIALSYVRAHADELGIDTDQLHRHYHLHVPAGAVPKDGPSAGITMTTALVSLLTRRPVRGEVAMTGEVTLQGRVLPIGGVKQKVLAARRAGLTTVVLPSRNLGDLDDLTPEVRAAMTFRLVDRVDDVLEYALEAPVYDHAEEAVALAS
jgi:ATP-dependent Lon protease